MANNCLVTKLKSTVDNNNLIKLGELKLNVSLTNLYADCVIGGTNGTVTIEGDGYLINQSTSQQVKSVDFGTIFTLPAGTYKLSVDGKYNIETLYNLPVELNLDDIKYCEKITSINNVISINGNLSSIENLKLLNFISHGSSKYSNVSGDLSSFNECSLLNTLILHDPELSSNIETLSNHPNLANFLIIAISRCTYVTGSLDTFIANAVQKGITNKSIYFIVYDTSITIGEYNLGTLIENNDSYLKWTSANVYYYQNGSDADVADSSKNIKIFAKGATPSQISTWLGQGNTVYTIS